jgi:hypothetical protein
MQTMKEAVEHEMKHGWGAPKEAQKPSSATNVKRGLMELPGREKGWEAEVKQCETGGGWTSEISYVADKAKYVPFSYGNKQFSFQMEEVEVKPKVGDVLEELHLQQTIREFLPHTSQRSSNSVEKSSSTKGCWALARARATCAKRSRRRLNAFRAQAQ